jgi:hypothetical protein
MTIPGMIRDYKKGWLTNQKRFPATFLIQDTKGADEDIEGLLFDPRLSA